MNRLIFLLVISLFSESNSSAGTLPGTAPLDWDGEDFSEQIMEEAHSFVERKIAEAATQSYRLPATSKDRDIEISKRRKELRFILGVVDERPSVQVEFVDDSAITLDGIPLGSLVAEGPGFLVHQIRWSVLPGFSAEGLYVTPTGTSTMPTAPPAMILIPDAGETPEDILGLTAKLKGQQQMGLRFATAGFRLVIPTTISRDLYKGADEDEALIETNQSHREWIYRQAFQMGRHPLGYEIQSVLAAVDWLRNESLADSITVAGWGEGGRTALYSAAVDERIDHAFVSGAFAPRHKAWSEPIDRNIFDLLPQHGDAEVASLIFPRPLLIEHTVFPDVETNKGKLETPGFPEVNEEFDRIAEVLGSFSTPSGFLIHEANRSSRADYPAVAAFLQTIGIEREISRFPPIALLIDSRMGYRPDARHERVFEGMQTHVQHLVDGSLKTRREFYFHEAEPGLRPGKWSVKDSHPSISPLKFIEESAVFRETFREKIIGTFDESLSPPNPRSRTLTETKNWIAHDVVLDVYPGFHSWGTLLIPKNIKPGEKRPLVVCQHGRNGLPRDTIDAAKPAYNDFAGKLADRGFITFAPFNLYRGEDDYRWLDRKANLIGGSLFTFIAASHRQNLNWLNTLPEVDPDRIAFYGLSYGGEAAMRIPAILDQYCLSICSGDFNQWTRKVADPDFPKSFMRSKEWEMPYWNMGNTFDYGEMAGLIFPRPFFVERGHHDIVSEDEFVAFEYARVRRLYATFGMSERTGIEYFEGGHSINGRSTFEFLHNHLDWPQPQ
ncbi:MAG: hypothetical protein P1U68_11125 [Verrucomicrobiales bacterium]|nr:hypothetical protein [Verrucomicrobiales bacterium]